MGKSTSTCFKIITCGNHSAAETDGFDAPESKSSSDRRGWSFRKRSERHRVLNNTVISETQSTNKDIPETQPNFDIPDKASTQQHNSNFPEKIPTEQPNSDFPEKISTEQPNFDFPEKTTSTESLPDVPEQTDAKEPESNIPEKPSTVECTEEKSLSPTTTDETSSDDVAVEVVQVEDNKDEITLTESDAIVVQTAIRVFLAQNSLLKHKKAIKLQAAVRGHLVRRHAVGTLRCVQAIVKMQALVRARHAKQGTKSSSMKPRGSYVSIQKLLSNRIARQLLESSPRTKTINIKCDPAKPDSGWTWLERWMAVSTKLSPSTEVSAEQLEKQEVEDSDKHSEAITHPETQSTNTFECVKEAAAVPSDSDENLIAYNAESQPFQEPSLTTKIEEPQPQDLGEETKQDEEKKAVNPEENDSFDVKTDTENDQLRSMQPEGKKLSFGSKKASNPAFIAAQSKFEELASSGKVTNQENETYSTDKISSPTTDTVEKSEISFSENSVDQSPVQVGESECSTELLVSSALDSPDRSDINVQEFEPQPEPKTSMDTDEHHQKSNENLDIEIQDQTSSGNEVPNIDPVQPETHVVSKSESEQIGTEVVPVVVEQKPETNATEPEPSPRSHITFSESQGTPPSKVSEKPKKRTEKSGSSNAKRRLSSAGSKSPSNPNQEVGTTSLDQLTKDQRSGKRRNSLGSGKSENLEQEPRDSSSTNSLPSYMQATESARAKAISNNSPRSSPDVHSKEAYVKKRQSLPGSNGRQESPRIQRSLSQAQQNAKGNGSHSPHERKWQR